MFCLLLKHQLFKFHVEKAASLLHESTRLLNDTIGSQSTLPVDSLGTLRYSNSGFVKRNNIALAFGVISVLCLNGVASFQFHNAPIPHLTFAAIFFLFMIIYMWLAISIDTALDTFCNRSTRICRWLTAVLCTLVFLPFIILQLFQVPLEKMSAAACEITMTLSFLAYFLTFVPDFATVDFEIVIRTREGVRRPRSDINTTPQ